MLFSQKLYELRKERNLTLQAVHLKTGIALASLSAYERGRYAPSIENLCKLAKFYKVPLDELLRVDVQLKVPMEDTSLPDE